MKKGCILSLLLLCACCSYAQSRSISFSSVYSTLDTLEGQVKSLNLQFLEQQALSAQLKELLSSSQESLRDVQTQLQSSQIQLQQASSQAETLSRQYALLDRKYRILKVVSIAGPVLSAASAVIIMEAIRK